MLHNQVKDPTGFGNKHLELSLPLKTSCQLDHSQPLLYREKKKNCIGGPWNKLRSCFMVVS